MRRSRWVHLLLAASVVVSLLTATSAEASHCGGSPFCIYGNTGYSGDLYAALHTDTNWPCGVFCTPDVDNNEDSVINNYTNSIVVYDWTNFGGGIKYCVVALGRDSNINDARDNDGDSHLKRNGYLFCYGLPSP